MSADHSWQKIWVDGLEYDTNGINMVRLHGATISYGTRTHKRVLEAFKSKQALRETFEAIDTRLNEIDARAIGQGSL